MPNTWKNVILTTLKQLPHRLLVFIVGMSLPGLCVFSGIKFVDWMFNHNTSTQHMWLGVGFGLGIYSFLLIQFIRWVKLLDKELP